MIRATATGLPARLLAAAFLFLVLMAGGGAAATLDLAARDSGVPLAGHISVYHDPSGTMTFDEARADAGRFHPIEGNFNVGYSPQGAWWLHVSVMPEPGQGGIWYLAINARFTDMIQVHAPDRGEDGTRHIAHKTTGALFPPQSRDLLTNTYVVRVFLPEGEETDLFLRLSGARSLSAQPVLWRLPDFVEHLTLNVLIIAIAIGAAGITSIGALIFGLWLRSPPFAWYGAYVGATALNFLANAGFLALILDPLPPFAVLRLQGAIGCLGIFISAFMVRSIFCPPGRHPFVRLWLSTFGVAGAAGMAFSVFGHYGLIAPALMVSILVTSLIVPILAAARMVRGEAAGLWYFIGFTSYAAATWWFALVVFGLLPIGWIIEWGYQTIGLLHMAAIFAGMASALRAGARERRLLQGQLLRASQENAAALERAVERRTAELRREVGAREQAEAALRVALREQRNFLVMVSHEFRTPLATMRAAIAIIVRGSAGLDAQLRREGEKIVRALTRLTSLIDTFLAEEWIDRAAMRAERASVDVAALAVDICREQAAQGERTIETAGLRHATIEADPVLLRTLIENLVSNALKYSDGDVRLDIGARDTGIVLRVSDAGAGIVPEEQEAIFERYYRSPTRKLKPGAGIGLHIAKRVVEMHRGSISVTSSLGAGSTFEVWLPERAAAEPASPSPLVPAPGD
ncbi:sensor histidine kinase [Aquabacter spiritensis]|uniref:sensor histidine kinase n=1 Tax=Aquabacter spiritensis TaxID=933073 RepID=UPI001405208A|nr:sensor histidine kinase [Aquabacter spiritensis]